jgi:hypothetical protein
MNERSRIAAAFQAAVNMSADELESWLETPESRAVGWKGRKGELTESVGHSNGRRIVSILRSRSCDLGGEDYELMRKTVGFAKRHLAQRPQNDVTSRWRYALMNWGHDPLRRTMQPRPSEPRSPLESDFGRD